MTRIRFDHIAIGMSRMGYSPRCSWAHWAASPPAVSRPVSSAGGSWTFEGGGAIEILEPMETTASSTASSTSAARASTTSPSRCRASTRSRPCRGARATTSWVATTATRSGEEAFLHPKQALGIVVQFAESAAATTGPSRTGSRPRGPLDPAAARHHCRAGACGAHSGKRARRAWETVWKVIRARRPKASRSMLARLADAPRVEIDPARDEGPVAIELASDRAIALPAGPHPALGTGLQACQDPPA